MKFLQNLKLCCQDISGKSGREYLIVGWIILLIGIFLIALTYKITSIICAYKIGLIVMTILVVFVIAPIFVFSLYKEYKKECKEIESGEKNEN